MSFVYASPTSAESGSLAGIVNHTEGRWWSYTVKKLVNYRRERILGYMILAPLVALILSMLVGTYVDWRMTSIRAEIATLKKGMDDWNDYYIFNQTHHSNIPVKTFAALHRPSMEYSWSFDQYMDRRNAMDDKYQELKENKYQYWPPFGGAALFLLAWFCYMQRRHDVEATVAVRMKTDLGRLASMQATGPGISAVA